MLGTMRGLADRPEGTHTASQATSPHRVGRYQLLDRLAAGGMGEVFAACQRGEHGFSRIVALKRIRPQFSSDVDFVRMFLNEARLASQLDHPNIVCVHDFGREDDEYHLIMEYLHGASLLEIMRAAASSEQPVPLPHALAVVASVLAGLHHAHELRGDDGQPLGIVHRDVSPGNVMVTYDGEVKILDFGIARATQATQTAQGTRKGKVQYMSPEQCHGLTVDRRSDVFAVGIILYELCTMARPFRGDNEFAVMNAIVSGRFRTPSQVVDFAFPPALEQVILRALATDRDARFQTAQQMMDAVEQAARSLAFDLSLRALGQYAGSVCGPRPWPSVPPEPPEPLPQTPSPPPSQTPPPPLPPVVAVPASTPPSRWRWAPAAAIALAIGGLSLWLARPGPDKTPRDDTAGSGAALEAAIAPSGSTDPPPSAALSPSAAPAPSAAAISTPPASDLAVTEPPTPAAGAPPTTASSRSSNKSRRRRRGRRKAADSPASTPASAPEQGRDLRGIDGLLPSKE